MKTSFFQTIKSIFCGSNYSYEQEDYSLSPLDTVAKNFFENKVAVTGLITFVATFFFVFLLSAIYPLDLTYQDVTQQDIPPGFNLSKIPPEIKDNPRSLSIGSRFSVGADKNGDLYVWGKLTENQKNIPSNATDIIQVSAGLDHMLALDSSGQVHTWGNNRFGLENIPFEVQSTTDIKQIIAGDQFSVTVSHSGELSIWGNTSFLEVDMYSIPENIQYHVASAAVNSNNIVLLLDDGSLEVIGRKGSAVASSPPKGNNFVQIATTEQCAIALTDKKEVVVWGNDFYNLLNIPPSIQGTTKAISSGRSHLLALLDDGSLVAWGNNNFGQIDIPTTLSSQKVAVSQIFSGYFQNYVVSQDGTVHSFGLKGYLMGTDELGRDIFLRLIYGGRLTLTVGAIAVLISVFIGVFIGAIAGFYGGLADLLLMRFAEIIGCIPFLPLAMTLSVLIGNRISQSQRIIMIMIILGALSWPSLARLVRGQILSEREKEFVLAARATGVKEMSIIFRYIVPNIITPIIISATLSYATSMLIESTLSFLGFGVVEPNPTWGNMLNAAQNSQVIANSWWRWVFPSLAICITTVSINLIGDGLRDAIDPRSSER